MFLLGIGLGAVLTSQGCRRKGRLPGEEETAWLLEAVGTPPAGAAREARRALGRKIK